MKSREQFEDLLAQLIAGERAPDDAEIVAAVEADPSLQPMLEEAVELSRTLTDAARQEQEVLSDAENEPSADDLVERTLGPLMNKRPRRGRMRPWTWGVLAAAAAVIVFLLARTWWSDDDFLRTDPGNILNVSPPELTVPGVTFDRYGTFQWKAELPVGGWYELRIDSLTPGVELQLPPIKVTQPEWTPDPATLARLPDAIRWTVVVKRADGSEVTRASQESRRAGD